MHLSLNHCKPTNQVFDWHQLTRRNIDGHEIFSQLVADNAGDSQVHLRDHSDFMGGLAIDVSALLLETEKKIFFDEEALKI